MLEILIVIYLFLFTWIFYLYGKEWDEHDPFDFENNYSGETIEYYPPNK